MTTRKVVVRLGSSPLWWIITCPCCHEAQAAFTWADAIQQADQHVRVWHS